MLPEVNTTIDILFRLLPGFIAAAILYLLTPNPRPSPFERTVGALIFTGIIQAIVWGIQSLLARDHGLILGAWTPRIEFAWSILVAIVLGVVLATCSNHDTLYTPLRWMGITKQTSYSSEWYAAFSKQVGWTVLHLTGQRRILGWVEEWPNAPDTGHFVLRYAEWLEGVLRIPTTGVDRMLIKATDVEIVEFLTLVEPKKEEEHGRPQGTEPATDDATPTEAGSAGQRATRSERRADNRPPDSAPASAAEEVAGKAAEQQ